MTTDRGEAAFRAGLIGLPPQLRAFARFLGRDADDLVQETTLRALAA